MTLSNVPYLALLDSGVGGLATLELLLARFPNLSYAYLADGAYFPYGPKTALVVRERVASLMEQLEAAFSLSGLVIACNTAAQEELCSQQKSFPLFDPIDSTCRAIRHRLSSTEHKAHIALLATPTTVDTGRYPKLLHPQFEMTQLVTAELVTAVEAGYALDSPEMQAVLLPIFERIALIEPDAIVLGCTHFSWVESAFQTRFPEVMVFNSAACLADDVAQLVEAHPELLGNQRQILNTKETLDFELFLARLGLPTDVKLFDRLNYISH